MFRNTLKTTVLLAGLGGLMVAIGSVFGRGGVLIGLVGLAVVGFSSWKSDALAIRAARAAPAEESQNPEYFAVVRELVPRPGTFAWSGGRSRPGGSRSSEQRCCRSGGARARGNQGP